MPDSAAEARRRFDRPELAPLWREARRRFEEAVPVTRLSLRCLSEGERRALADLLGMGRLPEPACTIAVSALDRVLIGSPARLNTRGVVEAIGGPLADRTAERRTRRVEREELWSWLASHPVVRAEPALLPWAEAERRKGPIDGDVARTKAMLTRTLDILAAMPANGQPLASFAQQLCSDPHGLDERTRLGGLVLRALACLHDVDPPADAEERRRLWELAGVACDAISTAVLVAGLRPDGAGPLASGLRAWADASQAVVVTLGQLRADGLGDVHRPLVFVVENPTVLAEALARFCGACPPLVCTSGWPNLAAVTLLRRLAAAGMELAYHGDLDGEGVRIAAHVFAKTGARPWRMSAADYRASVRSNSPAAGRITEAPWDAELAPAMRAAGATVSEESVIDALLEDLARHAS
jgi:uncharacterized protein (TIGR02679 family)